MPRNLLIIAAVMLCLASVPGFAQQTPPMMPKIQDTPMPPAVELPPPPSVPSDVPNKPLTADEAVQIALRHQPSIMIAQAGVNAAQGRSQQARAGQLPSLVVGAGRTEVNSNGTSIGGGGSVVGSQGTQVTASVRQLIFDFDHTRDLVRQASAQHRSAMANLTRAESDLAYQVKQAFYTYAQNVRLVEVNEANVKNRQGHLDLAQARLKSGVGLPADVVRAETAREEAILGLTQARNNASISRVVLAQMIGIDPRTPIAVADTAEASPDVQDVDGLIGQALRMRPEILQAQAAQQAAEHGVSAAETSNSPVLSANAGWLQRGDSFPLDNRSLGVGINVTWSLFDSGLTAGRVREATSSLQTANAQLESTRLTVISDVSQAYLNLKTAEQRVVTAGAQVVNATEAVRLTEGRYRSGLGTFIDMLDAQTALLTANTNHVNALSAVNTTRAALARAVGTMAMPQM